MREAKLTITEEKTFNIIDSISELVVGNYYYDLKEKDYMKLIHKLNKSAVAVYTDIDDYYFVEEADLGRTSFIIPVTKDEAMVGML